MWSPFVLVAQVYLCLVSQVFFVGSLECQSTMVVSLAPRPIDRGDVSGITGEAQKQGSTKAAPVGRKSVIVALVPIASISQLWGVTLQR